MLPEASDFLWHPLVSVHTAWEVWRLTTLHASHATAEKRRAKVDDMAKRHEYRKAHGLDKGGFFDGWGPRPNFVHPPPPGPSAQNEASAQNEPPER